MFQRTIQRAAAMCQRSMAVRTQAATYCSEPDDGGRSFSEAYVNKVMLMGRVGHAPSEMNTEAKSLYFPLGQKNFASEQDWHTIHVYDQKLKEYCKNRVKTGDRIFVLGSLEYSKSTPERPHKQARIIAKEVKMVSRAQRNRVKQDEEEEHMENM